MYRFSFFAKHGCPLAASIACLVMACNSPVTKSDGGTDSTTQTSSSAAGGGSGAAQTTGAAANASSSSEGSASKQLSFGPVQYTLKTDGEQLIIQQRKKGDALPDSSVQPGFTGILYDAAIGDLDNDHQPEIYAFTRSQGSNSYGSVFGVALQGHQGVRITFPDVAPATKGYAGQDSFYIDSLHRLLVRQFPVTDSATQRATPVVRTLKYKLIHTGQHYALTPVKP
ncbi:hypothetical protein GA0116948_12020 [Chitinophaga costaii]|uniref:Lipoprotein n=1 Tax=Chitinophaga costaii TaxID=1335309 RepID=A0A1C4G3B2_9BACT|nr:hypothetical protein [Chitinophaga costaii]PUZ19782.1 hypothetical protein DCM91_20120 [Chitinophaga costaii]SCC62355.1 hypothetical protein GA0116948_12020 [Chitinophaga costaii]